MRLLADTHAVIWLLLAPEKLSGRVAAALADPANLVLVSAVSGYEIEFKRPRSAELQRLPGDLQEGLVRFGFDWCAVEPSDAIAAGRLPR
ncbi:MAG: type II toxin-antitoxin system VapC family toxin, partial [Caulobacteraceae bacterium]